MYWLAEMPSVQFNFGSYELGANNKKHCHFSVCLA